MNRKLRNNFVKLNNDEILKVFEKLFRRYIYLEVINASSHLYIFVSNVQLIIFCF